MIYAIGDLHLDSSGDKPMDIFGDNWINHSENIFSSWKESIRDEDLVLIPGDISWGLKLIDAEEDLRILDKLPGKKILSKGNHDYWWESMNKINALGLETISFLQNNSYTHQGIAIAGTRGWSLIDIKNSKDHSEKIYKRELNRLELSLSSIRERVSKKIVLIHYPPFDQDLEPNEFVEIMKKHQVDICIYGHLHGEGHRFAREGSIEGIEFHCVASDFIDFVPKKIL